MKILIRRGFFFQEDVLTYLSEHLTVRPGRGGAQSELLHGETLSRPPPPQEKPHHILAEDLRLPTTLRWLTTTPHSILRVILVFCPTVNHNILQGRVLVTLGIIRYILCFIHKLQELGR